MDAADPEHTQIDPEATLRHLETPSSTLCKSEATVTFTPVLRAKGASCIIISAVKS